MFLGLNSYQEGVVIIVCINMIAVLGMSVLTGFTRLFSFGNAGFMSIGAYASAIFSVKFHTPFALSVVVGAMLAGVIAYLLGSLTIGLRGDYFLISCLGFGECVRVLFNYTTNITGGATGYTGIPARTSIGVALICALAAFVLAWNLVHSRFGQSLTAIREDEVAAASSGINVFQFKRLAFVFSAVYAGWAGALYAHYLQYISTGLFDLGKSSELIITTVLGGQGSLTGSVIGTLVIQLLPEIFRGMAGYRMLLYGIAVVVVILVKPSGLYGYKEFSLKRCIAKLRTLTAGKEGKV